MQLASDTHSVELTSFAPCVGKRPKAKNLDFNSITVPVRVDSDGTLRPATPSALDVVTAARLSGRLTIKTRRVIEHGSTAAADQATVAKSEFGVSERTARRERKLVEAFGPKVLATIKGQGLTGVALQALADLPHDMRADLLARAIAGETINPVAAAGEVAKAQKAADDDPVLQLIALFDKMTGAQQERAAHLLQRRVDAAAFLAGHAEDEDDTSALDADGGVINRRYSDDDPEYERFLNADDDNAVAKFMGTYVNPDTVAGRIMSSNTEGEMSPEYIERMERTLAREHKALLKTNGMRFPHER